MIVHIETKINASAETVWDVIGRQFADIDNWSTTVESSRAMAADEMPDNLQSADEAPVSGRVTTTRFGTLTEVLTSYSDSKREFVFTGANLPPFLSHAKNHTRVIETGEQEAKVVFDVDIVLRRPFNVLNPIVEKRFHRTWGLVQADLKHYTEAIDGK